MIDSAVEFVRAHAALFAWLSLASVVLFVGSIAALPWLVVKIPPNYFAEAAAPPSAFRNHHPALRIMLVVTKNLLGFVLVVMGVLMLVLPGQGLLAMFVGLLLLSFPGKRRFEIWLVRRRAVLKALNWLRTRAKHPPLRVLGEKVR